MTDSLRRLILLLIVPGLPACGDESPAVNVDGALPTGDGGADTASGCGSVCWSALPRPPSPIEGETATFTSEECRCPQAFACTGTRTITTSRLTSTHPVCEAIDRQTRPVPLVFDFRDQPTVAVGLRFRVAGGPWPQSPVAGSAGQITITLEQPQAQRVLALPIDASGLLTVSLPPGRHRFQLEMGRGATFDPWKYPITNLAGTLLVERAGEVTIDVPATPVMFELRLDGVPFPAPGPGEAVALRIEGRTGHRLQVKRGPGETLTGGTIWLEPGKYVVTLTTEGRPTAPTLPSGSVVITRALEVGSAPLQQIFDVGLLPVTGAITLDGHDLPPSEAEIELVGPDGESRATVPAERPARYRVLAYRGVYDLVFSTALGNDVAGIPTGGARLLHGKLVDQPLTADLALRTATWPIELTANGAAVADAPHERGKLQLSGGISATLALGAGGPIRLHPLVYQGTDVQVTVVGASDSPLPGLPVPLATGLSPPAPARLDLTVAPVTVRLRVDGGEPPAAPVPRGLFRFSRADGTPDAVTVAATSGGPLSATLTLAPGVWRAQFQGSGAPGAPAGDFELPELVVPREGLDRSIEVSTVEAVIELRQDGALLPDAAAGKDRGLVQVGSTRLRLPRTGPSRLAVRVFPGVTALAVICDDACGAGLPSYLTLSPFVALGSP